jgi:hypothetical protein
MTEICMLEKAITTLLCIAGGLAVAVALVKFMLWGNDKLNGY